MCIAIFFVSEIITYKSLTGDYSDYMYYLLADTIITYKSLTGDYSNM